MKLKRCEHNPILSPNPSNAWESLVVTNPAAWYDEAEGKVLMLYRAAGNDDEHRVYFGLAESRDGYHFERVSDEPVFSPGAQGMDGGCVEDPRIVKIGDWYYVTYASRPFPPGKYWLNDQPHPAYKRPECPEEFPWLLRSNATSTYLAMTKDFRKWYRAGRITGVDVDDRDVILFPEKINGWYYMLHRPMNWVGPDYGTEYPAMWISRARDLLCWESPKLLATGVAAWENGKIGGNTPPIKTELGWLHIYHAVGKDKHYRLGALVLDAEDPSIVRYRTRDWLLQPEEDYEINGPYKGVCFPCGNVVMDGTLFVYYGGADKYCAVATCPLADLLRELAACPVDEGREVSR